MPPGHRARRVAVSTVTATAAAVALSWVLAPAATAPTGSLRLAAAAAPADPGRPTERELRKRLDELNTEAERLTERFNKARVDLAKARRAERDAAKTAAELEAKAAPARAQLGRLAAASYMSGGPDALFLSSGDAEALSASAYLVQNQTAALGSLQAQIDQADRAQRVAAAKAAQAEQAAAQVETARKAAKAKVDEVVKQLDKLTTTKAKDPRTGLTATVKGSGLPAKMARKALTKLGSPYRWGGAGPNSFDCSGLVVWAYAQVGKKGLPHYTGDLYQLGRKVSRSELRSGDLVYFGSDLHHMGIYLSGGKYLHAPQTGDVVKISRLSDRSDYAGANRIS